jgi:hypothetical protein
MVPLWLAWLLAATPGQVTLWLRADFPQGGSCHLETLTSAIHAQRPDVALVLGQPPGTADLQATLTESATTLTLTMQGRGKPMRRELQLAGEDCGDALQTAALMIGRYLDEIAESSEEARIEGLSGSPGSRVSLLLTLGGSVVRAPAGWTPGLILETDLSVGWLLFSLGGEINLAQTESDTSLTGTYRLLPVAAWLSAGVAPRLGPGRILAQASGGLSLMFVTIGPTTPPTFQQQRVTGVDPYLGLRVGYLLDLPWKFSLTLRYEERWVPAPTTFSVEGYPGSVSVRAFSGDVALLIGYTFF